MLTKIRLVLLQLLHVAQSMSYNEALFYYLLPSPAPVPANSAGPHAVKFSARDSCVNYLLKNKWFSAYRNGFLPYRIFSAVKDCLRFFPSRYSLLYYVLWSTE